MVKMFHNVRSYAGNWFTPINLCIHDVGCELCAIIRGESLSHNACNVRSINAAMTAAVSHWSSGTLASNTN